MNQDLADRDPKSARESFEAFKELVTRFPESKYAEDARARMRYLVNSLAQYEVHVARYYMKRGAYVAAANRAQFAIQNYPQAPALEEAVLILAKASRVPFGSRSDMSGVVNQPSSTSWLLWKLISPLRYQA